MATITFAESAIYTGETVRATVETDKAVSGVALSDVTVDAGSVSNLNIISTTEFTVDVTAPATGAGTVVLTLAEDAFTEGNPAATASVRYAPMPVTLTAVPASGEAGDTIEIIAVFEADATDVELSDFTKDAGTLSDLQGADDTWGITLTLPALGAGTVRVRLPAGSVIPYNAEAYVDVVYRRPPGKPAAPQHLTVTFPTATSALLRWDPPAGDALIDTYAIRYDGVWIDTGSSGTRYLVKGLQRGTEYTWSVRGENERRVGDVSAPVTGRTPIAVPHNALFFKECVNYLDNGGRVSVHGDPTQLVREVADNDYKTSTTEKDLDINIAVNGAPTRVDAIFVKGIGIEGHSAVPTGGSGSGYSNRRMPETVKNWEGTDVSTVVNGFQHDLFLLEQHFTATSVRLTFTGTDAKIVEVMCLEFGLEINANSDFTEIAANFVDREGIIHSDPGGGIVYDPPIGGERDKWEVTYTVKVSPGKTILETPEDFLYWRSENRNHVHAQEPSRFPWRVFPATFMRKSVPVRYRTDNKNAGEVLNFRVAEQ